MMDIDLVFMAAGLSSRFGGDPKILCNVGPSGETIFEMNIVQLKKYIRPKKIHIICNKKTCNQILKEVARVCGKYDITAEISHNIQESPSFRTKPWGTADALASAKDYIHDPFILLNSDDLYGTHTFESISKECDINKNYIVGFRLANTLMNEHKANRGFISFDADGKMNTICEKLHIDRSSYTNEELNTQYVSVNLFVMQPDVVTKVSELMDAFKETMGNDSSLSVDAEAMLPDFINTLLYKNIIHMDAILSNSRWLGVTYKDDIPLVTSLLHRDAI